MMRRHRLTIGQFAPGSGMSVVPAFYERREHEFIIAAWNDRVTANAKRGKPAPGTHTLGPGYGIPDLPPSKRCPMWARP